MKDNRYLKIIVCVLLVILLLAGGLLVYKNLTKNPEKGKESELKTDVTPFLYEVTKEGSSNKIYLFGSIHAAVKEDLDSLPEYVINAYKNSSYLACEIDDKSVNDPEVLKELTKYMVYDDGSTIKDHLSEETYNKLVNFLNERGMYSTMLDIYKPAYFLTLLEQLSAQDAGLNLNNSVDSYMLNKAREDNKTILEVESVLFQIELLYGFPDVLYDYMIDGMVDEYDETINELKELYNYWKKGDISGIDDTSKEEFAIESNYSEELKKAIDVYESGLIIDRNVKMTEKAIEYFNNNQDVFFMVGSAHIVGDKGIAKLLEENGYTVKLVK